uniref:Uncharacterized protein n=1 Tax=Lutzomyia longipalpis TaxID=7200 RepID=A0A1B0CQ69_LUTLO
MQTVRISKVEREYENRATATTAPKREKFLKEREPQRPHQHPLRRVQRSQAIANQQHPPQYPEMVPHSPVRTYAYQPFLGDLQVSRKIPWRFNSTDPTSHSTEAKGGETAVPRHICNYKRGLHRQFGNTNLISSTNSMGIQTSNQSTSKSKKKKKKTHRTAALWAKYKKMRDELREKTMENDKQN